MTLNLAIIGLGSMGALHLDALSNIPGVAVTAVCSRDPRKLTGDLRGLGGNLNQKGRVHDFTNVRTYPDWHDLLNDSNVHAVDICLPSDGHAAVTLAALAAGKHVLCEKPMALNTQDCERMIAAAEEHRRVLMIAHTLRFWPDYNYLHEFTREHQVVEALFQRKCGVPDWGGWVGDATRSGGAVLDLLIHDIDQAIQLFGMPHELSATSMGPVDTVRATLHYGTRNVHIEGGWLAAGIPFAMDFQVHSAGERLTFHDGVLEQSNDHGKRVIDLTGKPGAYEAELAYFVDCCNKNQQPQRCLPKESAQAVQLAALIEKSRLAGGQKITCAQ
jgi:predicted dehydrogenase